MYRGKVPSTAMASSNVTDTEITFRHTYEVTASCQRVRHAHKLLCHNLMPCHLMHLWTCTHFSETVIFCCLLKLCCTLEGSYTTGFFTSKIVAACLSQVTYIPLQVLDIFYYPYCSFEKALSFSTPYEKYLY